MAAAKTKSEAFAKEYAEEHGLPVAAVLPSFLMGPPRAALHESSTSVRLVRTFSPSPEIDRGRCRLTKIVLAEHTAGALLPPIPDARDEGFGFRLESRGKRADACWKK